MPGKVAERGDGGQVAGILNIDKPSRMTTMDVVRRIKRASGQKRVGHGGTLDPIATGVVPVCIGQATRTMEYLIEGTKEYRCRITLGVETDTYDSEGEVTATGDASAITRREIEEALTSFSGTVYQVPPMFSALKQQGKRLYDLARAGVEVEREPRKVKVHRIDVLEWAPPDVTVGVTCGRGFYMRSLAHDLGESLGCGGHVTELVRLRSGPFEISEAISLAEAEQRMLEGTWEELLHPADSVVLHERAAVVGAGVEEMIRHGRPLPPGLRFPSSGQNELCRVYSVDGDFVGILSFVASRGRWQPEKVFAAPRPVPRGNGGRSS